MSCLKVIFDAMRSDWMKAMTASVVGVLFVQLLNFSRSYLRDSFEWRRIKHDLLDRMCLREFIGDSSMESRFRGRFATLIRRLDKRKMIETGNDSSFRLSSEGIGWWIQRQKARAA